ELAMKPHPYRSEQRGEDDLEDDASAEARKRAEEHGPAGPRDQHQAEELGKEQQEGRGAQQGERQLRMPSGPEGEEVRPCGEIDGQGKPLLEDLAGGQQKEYCPQEGGEIGHHSRRHDGAMPRADAVTKEQSQVLEVSLAPAAVPLELVEKGRRGL